MSRTHWLCAAFTIFALTSAAPACAQGFIFPRPAPSLPNPQPLFVKSQKVTMQVTNGAMKVEVEQVFYNPNGVQMEGTYLFPLPSGAAVSNFRMTIDQEPVDGKILNVEDARRVYESFVRRNVDPAILEYVGRNAFQARVFPIPAGGEKRIFLGYSQPLEFNNGIYRADYPLASERVTRATAGDLTIDCTIKSAQSIKTVYSPSHEIQVKRENDHLARVSFEGRDVRADKDFTLYYTTSEKAFGLNALSYRKPGEAGFVMLMLAPKREVSRSEVQPKDVVFVFDTSGSMQGAKIEQARKALQTVLGALDDRDRFNVIRFSTDVESFKPSVVPANSDNRAAARTFVEGFKAVGGTNIDEALQAGLASLPKQVEGKRGQFVVFMTDGLPTIGETTPEKILGNADKAAPKEVRLFSFGVGADVNTLLLDRLARDHKGAADYVAPNEDLEAKIGSFYTKIADPVLSDVKLAVNGAELKEVLPSKIPDLFAGEQLLVLGRYSTSGKVSCTLAGTLNGKPQTYSYDLTLPERETENSFIPKLWANRRIGLLLETIRLQGENAELKDEVIRLSKEYGIVTPYTAYLVEEPGQAQPQLRGLRESRSEVRLYDAENRPLFRNGAEQPGLGGVPAGGMMGGMGGGGFGGGGQGVPGGQGGFGGRARFGESQAPAKGDAVDRAKAKKPGSSAAGAERGGQPLSDEEKKSQVMAKRVSGAAGARAPQGPPAAAAPLSSSARPEAGQKLSQNYAQRPTDELLRQRQQIDGYGRSTGWNAVEASRRVRDLKDKTVAESDVEVTRSIEGRTFRREANRWIEQGIDVKAKQVKIKYGSDAYFRLVAAKKEWARYLSLGREVTFRTGKGTVVIIGETGDDKLTDAELKSLEQ
jgi:Ca-activated chloride channel family protein